MREYVVTLKNFEDLEEFYDDMETPGGNLYIPDRCVEVLNRRPISVNTHYLLTDEEAIQVRNDPRVLACELTPTELGMSIRPHWIQTSTSWDKSSSSSTNYKNWGLLRVYEGVQRSNWGSDGTASQTGTVQVNAEGRNVDVVIVDGHINPSHPEFAKNSDGGGGTRVIQYNWLQHAATPGTYVYTPYTGSSAEADNNHGQHVAGTVAGNTQGWARQANIYNISPYGTNPNSVDSLLLFDYIRAWHNSKPINPITKRRNPTIVNNSWGFGWSELLISNFTSIYHRGTTYNSGLTEAFLNSKGIVTYNSAGVKCDIPARYTALEADIQSAINDGIIVVGAAGNDSYKIDVPSGLDYDNYAIISGFAYFYHRGMAPAAGANQICVGAVGGLKNDSKATYSNCGPRIDVYAPGSNIMSSLHTTGVYDPRSFSYRIGKYSGTSMASPQVTGVLACLLEIYPGLTQAQALQYLIKYSKYNQMTDTGGSYTDFTSLQSSTNRYLYYLNERPITGGVWPKKNYQIRPTSGRMFPRPRIKRL